MKPGMMGSGLHRAARRTILLFGVLLGVLAVANMVGKKPAYASNFTVNSTGDKGDQDTNNRVCNSTPLQPGIDPECTLRAAIEQANDNDNEATSVHTDATSGEVSFTFRPGKKVAVGQRITATATELDSNTSEFPNPGRIVARQ